MLNPIWCSTDEDVVDVLSGTSIGEVIVTNVGRGFNEVPNPRIIAPEMQMVLVLSLRVLMKNALQIVQPTNGWFAMVVIFHSRLENRFC